MTDWTISTLGEICKKGGGSIQTGPFGSQLHESDYQQEGTPVVMPADINNGLISTRRIARVSENHVQRLKRHKLKLGDIVYGRRGDIGRQALVRDTNVGWLCGTGCLKVTLGSAAVSSEFLHRYLSTQSVIGWIEGQAVGATMPNLNTGILERVPVIFPKAIETQQKIAAILSAYDDLIANNQRRITLLERMAEDIYLEWFVRLRFPGHENVARDRGVPAGWNVCSLGDVLELCYGKALKDEDRQSGTVPVYGSGGVVGAHSTSLVDGPGIVVGRKGNVGSVFWSERAFFPIDTAYFVRSAASLYYLVFLLRSMNFINNDSAVPGLSRQQAYSNKLLFPPNRLIEDFTAKVKVLFDAKRVLSEQNEVLKATRDALLPRLISGKLSVNALDIHFPPGMVEAG
ncbi:MAG: type I restriction endonuclease subunit S [Burkholderiales bacterium PBB3]|nr:MAG: type I restriction endonuclease subunit S [Burkholderiales bacterium PBB3]